MPSVFSVYRSVVKIPSTLVETQFVVTYEEERQRLETQPRIFNPKIWTWKPQTQRVRLVPAIYCRAKRLMSPISIPPNHTQAVMTNVMTACQQQTKQTCAFVHAAIRMPAPPGLPKMSFCPLGPLASFIPPALSPRPPLLHPGTRCERGPL